MDRRIDLGRARRDAKALLRAARGGDPRALARLRADREPRLADAQHAVARELGEPSWPALARRVEAEVEAGVDELLEAVFAGEHHTALSLARARPQVAEHLRGTRAPALIRAARDGRADAVYTLLQLGVDPDVRDPATGGTVLHVAARLGLLDVVDVLVGWTRLDQHARDATGATALDVCVGASPSGPEHALVARVLVSVGLTRQAAESAPLPEPDELGEAAWSADVELFAYLSRSSLAERCGAGDGFAFRTGLLDNTRNGVVCSRLAARDADDRIAELLSWLDDSGVPAQWMVAARTEPPDLRERLAAAGCRPERGAVFMASRMADRDDGDARAPAGLQIAAVRNVARLAEALAAADQLDDDPEQHDRELALLASVGLGDDRPLRHYAARLGTVVVGVASAFTTSSTVTLTNLGVRIPARRRGIGRALVLHALDEGRAAGCGLAVLAPTPATVPFYEALGFTLGRFPPDRAFYLPVAA